MSKRIWFFHPYATPPNLRGLYRSYDFAHQLIKKGHQARVFTASYLHYAGEQLFDDALYKDEQYKNVPFTYVRTRGYESKARRVLNMRDYYRNVQKVAYRKIKEGERPDVIIASSPHPLSCLAGLKIKKKLGIPCIVEIRDLWPESFVNYKVISKNNPVLPLLYRGEKSIYERADALIFTMPGGADYIRERGWDKSIDMDKIIHLTNGVDAANFQKNQQEYTFEDEDLDSDAFKVVFTGSIRPVYDLMKIVLAGERLQKITDLDIRILIFGTGNELEKLQKYCSEHNIHTVKFKGSVQRKYIPDILSKSNLNLIHFAKGHIQKYGMSNNKYAEYVASGKPILMTVHPNYDDLLPAHAGIVLDNQDVDAIADAILKFAKMDEVEYNSYQENVTKLLNNYDYEKLAERLLSIIFFV